jgi:Ser/Thr protein kinase RdoA (MazF antagonist)
MLQGFSVGARYSMRRNVAQKFLTAWTKKYKESPPFSDEDLAKIEDFICLTVH